MNIFHTYIFFRLIIWVSCLGICCTWEWLWLGIRGKSFPASRQWPFGTRALQLWPSSSPVSKPGCEQQHNLDSLLWTTLNKHSEERDDFQGTENQLKMTFQSEGVIKTCPRLPPWDGMKHAFYSSLIFTVFWSIFFISRRRKTAVYKVSVESCCVKIGGWQVVP